jgi:SAM-dependent methyltransferase
VLVTSRSFAEYIAFFALDPARLPRRGLDCSAGTSGFVAEASGRRCEAVAVDPAYRQLQTELAGIAQDGMAGAATIVAANPDRFTFDWYGSPERLRALRTAALEAFVTHRRDSPGRYLAAELPRLPFADGSFDLAVCSHLLFTWAKVLGEAWHEAALRELARVAREVRVFPLVHQGSGEPVAFLGALRDRLSTAAGLDARVAPVPFEFKVGAHEMLVVGPAP